MLEKYACIPEKTKGRIYPERSTPYRNESERDRDRIIHSNSFNLFVYFSTALKSFLLSDITVDADETVDE